jgi:hypothetical protein
MTLDREYRTRLVNDPRALMVWVFIVSKYELRSCDMMGGEAYRTFSMEQSLSLSITLIISTMVRGCEMKAFPSVDTASDDDSWYLVISHSGSNKSRPR